MLSTLALYDQPARSTPVEKMLIEQKQKKSLWLFFRCGRKVRDEHLY